MVYHGLSHWDDVILRVVPCTEDYSVMVSSSLSCARGLAMLPPDKNMMWVGPQKRVPQMWFHSIIAGPVGNWTATCGSCNWAKMVDVIWCFFVKGKPRTWVILVILALSADSQRDLPSRYLPTFWRKVSRITSPTIRRLPPISTLEGEGTGQCFLLEAGW